MPFKKETFNIVFCRDVLEHIQRADKAIKEMILVLKRTGVILVSTTNILNPWLFFDILLPKKVTAKIIKKLGGPEFRERHFRFSPWKIMKELSDNKLRVALVMFGDPPIGKP